MKNGRILVVDDQEILRRMISRILTNGEFEVTVASSAEEAIVLFREDPFPVVLTDIRMGGMSGLELVTELRSQDPDLVAIVMTSMASLETATQALRAGAYDFLAKPFRETDQVLRVIHRAREKRKLIGENRLLVEQLKINAEEMRDLNRRLHEASIRDGLTSLYNHRFFREALENELSRASRHQRVFSIIMIDVDHFKAYNDANGHPIGDLGLRIVAEVLENESRPTDIAARYGGEEFVLLTPETSKEDAALLGEKLRAAIEAATFPGAHSQPLGRVTISAGIASYPDDGATDNEVLEKADGALYQAKNTGRNRVVMWDASEERTGT